LWKYTASSRPPKAADYRQAFDIYRQSSSRHVKSPGTIKRFGDNGKCHNGEGRARAGQMQARSTEQKELDCFAAPT
jgi:hypothetical protein